MDPRASAPGPPSDGGTQGGAMERKGVRQAVSDFQVTT